MGCYPTSGHDTRVDEADGSVHSAHHASSVDVETGTQENMDSESFVGAFAQMWSVDDIVPCIDSVLADLSAKRELPNSDKEGGYFSSKCFSPSSIGTNDGVRISIKAPQLYKQNSDNIVKDCIPENNSLKSFSGYVDLNDGGNSFFSDLLAVSSYNEVSSGTLSNEKDALASLPDVPTPDTEGSSIGLSGLKEQKDTTNTDTVYNGQPSGDVVEDGDILSSSKTDMLPDLNLNHFASTSSIHSSHTVSIESLEDSIADARSNKVLYLNYHCSGLFVTFLGVIF